MLVLSRGLNQRIRVGDDVVITVLKVVGNKVRLGVEAPKEVPVHREEVWLKINSDDSDEPNPTEGGS